jgi:integrase
MSDELALQVQRFVQHKRTLARKYRSEEKELGLFVRHAAANGIRRPDHVTPELLDDFLASRPRQRPRSFNHLLGAVRCFFNWLVAQDLLPASPLKAQRRRVTAARIPFIFDTVQVRRLLTAAGALPDNSRAPQRGATYRTIFALCYGLGLRAGEACGLRLGDVDADRDLLVVRGGKFGKSRLVPHGPKVADLLEAQVERRRSAHPGGADEAPLFTFDGRRRVHPGSASQTFHHLVASLALTVPDGVAPPRMHDLRHSFAVGCLLRWYREGLDPASRLHHLSTFMGHVSPDSTAVYLSVTAALLQEANSRYEVFAEPAWSAVGAP